MSYYAIYIFHPARYNMDIIRIGSFEKDNKGNIIKFRYKTKNIDLFMIKRHLREKGHTYKLIRDENELYTVLEDFIKSKNSILDKDESLIKQLKNATILYNSINNKRLMMEIEEEERKAMIERARQRREAERLRSLAEEEAFWKDYFEKEKIYREYQKIQENISKNISKKKKKKKETELDKRDKLIRQRRKHYADYNFAMHTVSLDRIYEAYNESKMAEIF